MDMEKRIIRVLNDSWYGEVRFIDITDGDLLAKATRREKSEWLVVRKVWNADLSLGLTNALVEDRPWFNRTLKDDKGYSTGDSSKAETINYIKKAIRATAPRGTFIFENA